MCTAIIIHIIVENLRRTGRGCSGPDVETYTDVVTRRLLSCVYVRVSVFVTVSVCVFVCGCYMLWICSSAVIQSSFD